MSGHNALVAQLSEYLAASRPTQDNKHTSTGGAETPLGRKQTLYLIAS